MPEYLSPGVYVEEVSTGSKPIEGVSTSTTGMVGCTERGPEDIPILVTSNGEFRRIFGGLLDIAEFTGPGERVHAYLPHSVEGFFTNRGRRAYCVRVLPDDATRAQRFLFGRGSAGNADTVLLRNAPQDSGTPVNGPLLYALDVPAGLVGSWVRVGNGSRAEYRQVAAVGVAATHVALSYPLGFSYDADAATSVTLAPVAREADGVFSAFTLAADAAAGSTTITLTETNAGDAAALVGSTRVFEIGLNVGETQRGDAVDLGGGQAQVTLETPLMMGHLQNETLTVLDVTGVPGDPPNLDLDANAGDVIIYADNALTLIPGNLLVVTDTTGGHIEVRRIGDASRLDLDLGAYEAYPALTRVQLVSMADDTQLITVVTDGQVFFVTSTANLVAGMAVDVDGAQATIRAVDTTNQVTLVAALAVLPTATTSVLTTISTLSAAAATDSVTLLLSNRLGLAAGDVLRLGSAPDEEYVVIDQVSGPRGVAPDAGTVILQAPLAQDHASGTLATHQLAPTVDATRQAAYAVLQAEENATQLYVTDGSDYVATNVVSVTLPSGTVHYHRLSANAAGLNAREVELDASIDVSHEAGAALVERDALIRVQALDRGGWGNRLLVAVDDEDSGLASRAEVSAFNPPQELNLTTLTGVEAGTVLELVDPDSGATVGDPLKVRAVDRSANNLVTLDGAGLAAAHIAALNAALMSGTRLRARSREFVLSVFLLQRPDPAVPSRNDTALDSEVFRHLSMDPRHSRYIHRVIGTTWTPGNTSDDDGNPLRLADQRSEGESTYIRIRDQAPDTATAESIRLGPEALVDVLPSGRERPARLRLANGTDSVVTMADAMYQGLDNDEPRLRSGIFTLNNIQDISIVAVPGQTSPAVQQAVIDHCEADRYRFAVLDAEGPDDDSLADVQNQRQQFDTKYAALYHPWLTIPEPMPENLANIRQLAIPPSGHMLGIYARTDNERGVHKAPANTVVRGITGLTRALNKGEHDILNPFPKNINVTRDFRAENRGLRVWGARVITSDSDYKYVNVRRLLIFLEASIDRGLQWVVFEPNAEVLWARVRRAISNFLTVVWRNGALEGTTVEEAFFVKCDRTTMTQTDIDSGRLICEIGVAPVKPAEFVIVRIGLWTANAEQ